MEQHLFLTIKYRMTRKHTKQFNLKILILACLEACDRITVLNEDVLNQKNQNQKEIFFWRSLAEKEYFKSLHQWFNTLTGLDLTVSSSG